ncbi:hypothetical protein [Serratia marcescens]|uniref:hypothetical protein n=1 Tax=Serratia marcescens TaxID=615 RepID=UPI00148BE101|nr:hypothetical protein [Serratia marcescens]QJU42338.1 hypothetical protein HMI62_24860 [Serratia marcescens]
MPHTLLPSNRNIPAANAASQSLNIRDTPPRNASIGELNPRHVGNATHVSPPLAEVLTESSIEHVTPKPTMLTEKMALYSEYLHYGQNPADVQRMINDLEAILNTEGMKNIHHTAQIKAVMPALNALAKTLLTQEVREKKTQAQLQNVDKNERTVRELICAFASLPDILQKSDSMTIREARSDYQKALMDELAQSALKRLMTETESDEQRQTWKAEIEAIIHTNPKTVKIREQLEHFLASNYKKLQEPVQKGLREKHRQIANAIKIANYDIIQPEKNAHTLVSAIDPKVKSPPFALDVAEVAKALDNILSNIQVSIEGMSELPAGAVEPQHKTDKWCYSDGVHLSVLIRKITNTVHNVVCPVGDKLKKFYHDDINHEKLAPFPHTPLTSFSALPPSDKMWCLTLKGLAEPVLANAEQVERAAKQLKSAIKEARSAGVQTLPKPETAEEALLTELTIHTQDNPQVRLTNAIQEAQTLARHILSEPTVAVGAPQASITTEQQKKENKFSDIVRDVSGSLDDAARYLQESARLLQESAGTNKNEGRQTFLASNLDKATKIARHAQDVLHNGFDSVTGVRRHDKHEWIHKLETDIRKNWQGVTHLVRKNYHPYHLTPNGKIPTTEEKAFYHQLHLGILPLLNETEKLSVASRQLEMALIACKKNGIEGQHTVNRLAEQCRKINLKDIQPCWKQIRLLLSKRDIPLYLIGDEHGGHASTLGTTLDKLTDSLQKSGQILQDASWNAQWAPAGKQTSLMLTKLSSQLEGIKTGIKDAVEAATGTRPHNNPPEGMIAKDAGEWLAGLKQEYARMALPSNAANDAVAEIVAHLCNAFRTKDDPDGNMFRQRVELAMRDAEHGRVPWPLTAEEHCARTKSRKDYTLAWAEKSLTYRAGSELLLNHSLAGMLSPVKHSLIAPLRLLNLMLSPIKMEMTRRGMEKVRPGNAVPTHLIAKYESREYYQNVCRFICVLLPQLPKSIAAAAIVGYGLNEGGEYRDQFLKRAASRLPADMFWIGGFGAYREMVRAAVNTGLGDIDGLTDKQTMANTQHCDTGIYGVFQRCESQPKNTNAEKQFASESFEPQLEKLDIRGRRVERGAYSTSNVPILNQEITAQGAIITINNMQQEDKLRLAKDAPELAENIDTLPNHLNRNKKNGINREATQLDVPYRGFWEKKWDESQHSDFENKWYILGYKSYSYWKNQKIKYLEMIGRVDLIPSATNTNKSDLINIDLGNSEKDYDPTYRKFFHQAWDDKTHSESENKVFKSARKQYLEFRAENLSQYMRECDSHEKINTMSSGDKLFLTEENPELAENIEILRNAPHREEQDETRPVISSLDVPQHSFWDKTWDKSQHSEFANKWYEAGYNVYLARKAKKINSEKIGQQDLIPLKNRSNIPEKNGHASENIDDTALSKTLILTEEPSVKVEKINVHQDHSDPDGQGNTNPMISSLDIPYRAYWEQTWVRSQHSEHDNKVHEIGYNRYLTWKRNKIQQLEAINRKDLIPSTSDTANINNMSAGDKFRLEKEDPSLAKNIEMLNSPSHKIRQRDTTPVFSHLHVPYRGYWEQPWDENQHSEFANKFHEAGYNKYLEWKAKKIKYLESIGRHDIILSTSRGNSPANIDTMSSGDKLFLTEENPELAENIEMLRNAPHREKQDETRPVVLTSLDIPWRGFFEQKWDKSQHSEFENKWYEAGYNKYSEWKAKKISYLERIGRQDFIPLKSRSNLPEISGHASENIDDMAPSKTLLLTEKPSVKVENINVHQDHSDPDGQGNTNPMISSLDIPYRAYWEQTWDRSQHSEHDNKVHEIGYNRYLTWKRNKIQQLEAINRKDLIPSTSDTANINNMSAGDKFRLEKEAPSLAKNIEMLNSPSHKIRQRDTTPVFSHLHVPYRGYWEQPWDENQHSEFANKFHKAGHIKYLEWKAKQIKDLESIGRHDIILSTSRGNSPANIDTMSSGDKLFLTEENPELAENIEMLRNAPHREKQDGTRPVGLTSLDLPWRGFFEQKWDKSQHSEFANKWYEAGYNKYLEWKAKKN